MGWLWLFSVFQVAGGLLSPASHACAFKGQFYLTNCCAQSDVYMCLEGGCIVALGCTICTDTCWPLYRAGVAVRPGYPPGAIVGSLGWAYPPMATAAYVAGVTGFGEVYSLALMIGAFATRQHQPVPDLRCDVDCNATWHSDLWYLSQEVAAEAWYVRYLWKLPFDFWRGMLGLTPLLGFLAVLLGLEQRFVMLFLLVTMGGMASGAPVSTLGVRPVDHGPPWDQCNCVAGGKAVRLWERGNDTMHCQCPNGDWYWVPSNCGRVGWYVDDKLVMWSHGEHQWPLTCPHRVSGPVSVVCQWGSRSWYARTMVEGPLNLLSLVPEGSALCQVRVHSLLADAQQDINEHWGRVCATCLIDRRPFSCGTCVRDCWPDTGRMALSFARCGTGPRLTGTLEAFAFANRSTGYTFHGPVGDQGAGNPTRTPLEPGKYAVTVIDESLHLVKCPVDLPRPSGTYGFFPGEPPVNACVTRGSEVSELLGGAGLTGGFYEPVFRPCTGFLSEPYRVCPGYAWVSGAGPDGFITVKGDEQAVTPRWWVPPPRWLLLDFVFVLLFLMKLAEAKLVPLILLAVWWWMNQITAEAALHHGFFAAPIAAWCLRSEWIVMVLGTLNLAIFMRWLGPTRLMALACWKLAKGAFPLVLLLVAGATRGRTSVLGLQFCFDFTVDWQPSLLGWAVALVVSWAIFVTSTMSVGGWKHKARLYGGWCRVYQLVRYYVAASPGGTRSESRVLLGCWLGAQFLFPEECGLVVLVVMCFCGLLDGTDWAIEILLTSRPQFGRMARLLNSLIESGDRVSSTRLAEALAKRGIFLYDHMGQVTRKARDQLLEWEAFLEPVSFTNRDAEIIRDAARVLTCGASVAGKPVVARRGDEVLIGTLLSLGELPPGFVPTAPVVIRRCGKSFLGVVKASLTGRDMDQHPGNVMVLGTATNRSMGTCLGGLMYTAFHGAGARTLSSPSGPLNPRWWSPSDDVTVYPLPDAAVSLEPCTCNPCSAWVIRNDGSLCHGTLAADMKVELDVAMEVGDFRGSSGSPILCDEGHAIGMLISVLHLGGRVTAARYTKPWNQVPSDAKTTTEPPKVPTRGEFREAPLFMPTGTGKTTKIPYEYTKLGHKVLVLNPSVATVKSLGGYMEKLTGKHPSVYCGHDTTAYTRTTDSPLTYATYGRFLANPRSMLRGVSVVICDECHSHDPTVLLGIGRVRELAKEAGANLVLYATATPPGAPMVSHPSIIEAKLDVGEIPFYGHGLPLERYRTGRHLIFCHSKAECDRLAGNLAARGVKAVSYYRGKDVSIITEGDLVVVATDALSTGYSGNFDTVTDCGLVVEEVVEVTLDPTITISLRTVPASAELRMQRRGRTGRGRTGRYYHAGVGSAPSGVVRTGPVWSAIEAAVTWYGLEPDLAASLLRLYDDCPYTAAVAADIGEASVFFAGLTPLRMHPDVSWAKTRGTNWPLLVGVQRTMCREVLAPGPSDDPEWAGLKGPNPTPLLLRWGGHAPERISGHHIVDDLVRRLGVAEGFQRCDAGPILLVGLAVAGGMIYAHYTGSLVVVTDWEVKGGGHPLHNKQPIISTTVQGTRHPGSETAPNDAKVNIEAVEMIQDQVDWSLMNMSIAEIMALAKLKGCAAYEATSRWVAGTYTGGKAAAPSVWSSLMAGGWAAIVGHCQSVIAAAVAAYGAVRNPPLAAGACFLMGTGVCGNIHVKLASSLLLGAVGTALGTPLVGLTMAGSFLGGATVAPSLTTILLGAVGGWEGVVSAASATFDFMNGRLALEDLWYLIPVLTSPGAGLAGVALGLVLHAGNSSGNTNWINRLLTALPRSSVIPDGFFHEADYVEKVSLLLRRMSLTRFIVGLVERKTEVSETTVGYVWDLWEWLMRLLRRLKDRLKAYCPQLALPLWHCGEGWCGEWLTDGHVEARCLCGCVVTGDVVNNLLTDIHYSTKTCRHYWMGTIPVNMLGYGDAIPLVDPGKAKTVPVGTSGWLEVMVTPNSVILRRASSYKLIRGQVMAAATSEAYYVDGTPCSWDSDARAPALVYGPGQSVEIDGERHTLPYTMRINRWVESEDSYRVTPLADEPDLTPKPAQSEVSLEGELPPAAAALYALEQAAKVLEPHVNLLCPAVMDDCSTPSLCGSSRMMPCYDSLPATPEPGVIGHDKLGQLVIIPQDSSSMDEPELSSECPPDLREGSMEELSEEPPPDLREEPEQELSSSSICPCTDESSLESWVDLPLQSPPNEPVVEATVTKAIVHREDESAMHAVLTALRSILPSKEATRKLAVRMECCCERYITRYFSLSLTVADVANLCDIDVENHKAYCDSVSVAFTLRVADLVGNVLHFECDKTEGRKETACSYSYVWYGAPLGGRPTKPPVTRPVGSLLAADASATYVTSPDHVGRRIDKVTFWRKPRVCDSFLVTEIERARQRACKVDSHGYDYEEAIKTVRPHAAMGWGSNVSVSKLATPEGKNAVYERLNDIVAQKEIPFTLTMKKEVFFKDRAEPKAPRLICFPPLDFRVCEKLILGDPGRVAKAVLGPAYAFQYTPNQRVKTLVEMWKRKRTPCSITVDATCFDSSITEEDVELETELYALASNKPELVKALGKYYAAGPMVNPEGIPVGERRCRSSGVLTTAASNSISCFIKVSAACARIGLRDVEMLVAGDDCIIICERPISDPCVELEMALRSYGYNTEPKFHVSLDTANFCSTWLAECNADGSRHYFLTTDMRKALARMSSEYSDPIASALGYTLLYPWHPIIRWVVLPHLLNVAFRGGGKPDDPVWCQVHGNYYKFPLSLLPRIIVSLHGPAALRVTADTTKTKMEAGQTLAAFKLPGLATHRRKAGALRTRMLRAGGGWAELARGLLWHPGLRLKPPNYNSLPGGFPLGEPYYGVYFELEEPGLRRRWHWLWGLIPFLIVAIFG
uniref:Genome polyprotein n=1 Tax=Simian pegivirus TaxID=1454041 RepID=A0A067YSD2_9FLAV|nr:polyprotein precursor [Simian pegivirus]